MTLFAELSTVVVDLSLTNSRLQGQLAEMTTPPKNGYAAAVKKNPQPQAKQITKEGHDDKPGDKSGPTAAGTPSATNFGPAFPVDIGTGLTNPVEAPQTATDNIQAGYFQPGFLYIRRRGSQDTPFIDGGPGEERLHNPEPSEDYWR